MGYNSNEPRDKAGRWVAAYTDSRGQIKNLTVSGKTHEEAVRAVIRKTEAINKKMGWTHYELGHILYVKDLSK